MFMMGKIMTTKFTYTGLLTLALFALVFAGCDVGVNPLLFDGSPLGANVRVDTGGNLFGGSATDSLHKILNDIEKSVDSIKIFNITLLIDSTSGTNSANTISGNGAFSVNPISLSGDTLMTFTNVDIKNFSRERSIFDPALVAAGVKYNVNGITHLNAILKNPGTWPSTITVGVLGNSSMNGLHFNLKVKLYTQVFTTP
jgi:hypothetical protein